MIHASHPIARLLFRLARAVTPAGRRDWMRAMQTEADEMTDGQAAWAAGCLSTALTERIAAMITTGALTRLIAGAFVCGIGIIGGLIIAVSAHTAAIQGASPLALAESFIPFGLAAGLLVFGGLCLWLAGTKPALRTAGIWLFGLSAFGEAAILAAVTGFAAYHHAPIPWLRAFGAAAAVLSGGSLLARRQRVFIVTALLTLGLSVATFVAEMGRMPFDGHASYIYGFFGECLPALLLMAAVGLPAGQRARPAA